MIFVDEFIDHKYKEIIQLLKNKAVSYLFIHTTNFSYFVSKKNRSGYGIVTIDLVTPLRVVNKKLSKQDKKTLAFRESANFPRFYNYYNTAVAEFLAVLESNKEIITEIKVEEEEDRVYDFEMHERAQDWLHLFEWGNC